MFLLELVTTYGALVALTAVILALWVAVLILFRRASVPRVFISYRTADGKETADRIWGDLEATYTRRNVFMDHHGLKPGDEWPTVLAGALSTCDMVVAVVTPKWDGRPNDNPDEDPGGLAGAIASKPLNVLDGGGAARRPNKPRILDRNDWVRCEVEHGLNNSLIVMRVDRASFPDYTEAELGDWEADKDARSFLQSLKSREKVQGIEISSQVEASRTGRQKLMLALDRYHWRRGWLVGWWVLLLPILLLAGLGGWQAHEDAGARQELARMKPLMPTQVYPLEVLIDLVRGGGIKPMDYVDQTVVWDAQVIESFPSLDVTYLIVELKPLTIVPGGDYKVFASFDRERLDEAVDQFLKQGRKIRFYGRIQRLDAKEVTLNGCRLLPPG